ncbi:MAG: helix-turn-helix domain-containing protein [Candidatus Omnitrophota bacterium]
MADTDSFSGRLKAARKLTGFSQREIASRLSIDFTTYNRFETGDRAPNIEILRKIYQVTGVNLHWLLTGEGDMLDKPLNIRSIFPNIPPDDQIDEMIECLQVPAVYHALLSDFLAYKKKFEPLIIDYFEKKGVTSYITDPELRAYFNYLMTDKEYRDSVMFEYYAFIRGRANNS